MTKEQAEIQGANDDDTFIDAELEDFVIYRSHRSSHGNDRKSRGESALANEFVSLHEINEWGFKEFLFDGVIWFGGEMHYVQRVPFETLSIGGYGEMDSPAVIPDVWVQSNDARKSNVWYRLRTPAAEYKRYHQPFLWMAELAKLTVDFLSTHEDVELAQFQQSFNVWLQEVYGTDDFISRWKKAHGSKDFRHVIASQANFLWCQATQVDLELRKRTLWSEIHPRLLDAIPEENEKGTKSDMFTFSLEGAEHVLRRKTTVTPYVYDCFKHMPWEKFLYCQAPSVGHTRHNNHIVSGAKNDCPGMPDIQLTPHTLMADASIDIGDVVALTPDTTTRWKSNDADWYGYVQTCTETSRGRELGILWLYRPSDTQCLKAPYQFCRELFLSDHCNCGDSPVYAQEVIYKPRVAFFGDPGTPDVDFFVRQRYVESDGAWQTLQEAHFQCCCRSAKRPFQYQIGSTLLVEINKVLEPAVLVENSPDGIHDKVKLRQFLRRNRDYGDIKAVQNELIFTDQVRTVSLAKIDRNCQVRGYTEQERRQGQIPPPYNREGTGDFYFVVSQDLEGEGPGLQPLDRSWPTLFNEGWDPLDIPPLRPLRGLDIFCGGGNFGRGLEEGGAVRFEYAVDWYREAMHTYRANLKDKNDTRLFFGSVNDFLTQAMQAKGRFVAPHGSIEFIAAGSPCQGFSNANPKKGNDRALLNVSMVASVVSFVDFYRPKYALLENVKGMACGDDTVNMLPLLVSSFVGMGYQVRTFNLDAWNFGSAQSRSRIFISVAAPGMEPLSDPPHTHDHPEHVYSASLGKTPNGLRTGSRYTMRTPFKYRSIAEAVEDLPETDARTTCIPFPDHRPSRMLSTLKRVQLGCIPRYPGGGNFMTAFHKGYMPQAQIDAFPWHSKVRAGENSKVCQRIRRNGLLPTIMTAPRPEDGAGSGSCVHYEQERLLTVMEVRRGQGFPDSEVIIGPSVEQWKIVGNSVARTVALALGVSLRKAWHANTFDGQKMTPHIKGGSPEPVDGNTLRPEMAVIDGDFTSGLLQTESTAERLHIATTPLKAAFLAEKCHPSSNANHEIILELARQETTISKICVTTSTSLLPEMDETSPEL